MYANYSRTIFLQPIDACKYCYEFGNSNFKAASVRAGGLQALYCYFACKKNSYTMGANHKKTPKNLLQSEI